MSLPASVRAITKSLEVRLFDSARMYFRRMVIRAENVPSYDAVFSKWQKSGSTLDLREAAKPFGDYWGDIDFANAIDEIDSQSAHL